LNRVIISLLLLTLALPGFAQTRRRPAPRQQEPSAEQKQQFADDQEAINALHDKDIEANIALDPDKLESLWTDDIVSIYAGGPPVVGRDANSKRLHEQVEQMKSQEILAFNEEFQEVRIIADEAYEWGLVTARTRPMAGGAEKNFRLNMMRILKRQPDGTWRIARVMYNGATPPPQAKAPEPPKPEDKNKLKD
jgi:uncharacterized protein (TIGR02246 family)